MKTSAALFGLFLLLSLTSYAEGMNPCTGFFCPRDRVAHINFGISLATVKSADAETGKIMVEYDNFPGKIYSYDSSNLTKLVPQQEQMRVYNVNYHVSGGHVIASNPESQKVTVLFDNVTNVFTYGRDELTYGKGCLGNICVGGNVRESRNGHLDAKVMGVNPATGDVTVFFSQLGSYYTYPVENFSAL
ncbi:MAG: hypothetical protein ACXVBE_00150 [Bdellovibrionota bacterium]